MATINTYTIKVPDMTCQHCKMRISKSLEQKPDIQFFALDLSTHEVTVETSADREVILEYIRQQGYTPA